MVSDQDRLKRLFVSHLLRLAKRHGVPLVGVNRGATAADLEGAYKRVILIAICRYVS